ncbi:MAG: tape measure protein [Thauera sp.]
MANPIETNVVIKVDTAGDGKLAALSREVAGLGEGAGDAAPEFQRLAEEIDGLAAKERLVGAFAEAKRETVAYAEALQTAQAATRAAAQELRAKQATLAAATTAEREAAAALGEARTRHDELKVSVAAAAAELKTLRTASKASGADTAEYAGQIREARTRLAELRKESATVGQAVRTLAGDYRPTAQALKEAGSAADKAQRAFEQNRHEAGRAKTAYEAQRLALHNTRQALASAGIASTDLAGAQVRLAGSAQQAAQRAGELRARLASVGSDSAAAAGNVSRLGGVANETAGKLKGLAAAIGVSGVLQTAASMEALRAGLAAVSGDAGKAAADLDFVKAVANRAGTEVQGAAQAFLSLSAATKGTAVEGDATRRVFEAVSSSMAVAGKSSADTQNALTALAQMAGKGVVSMEELRGQLGEALPGAMNAAAKGLGVTTQELIALTESGQLTAQQLFPALVAGLEDLYGAGTQAGQTLGQEFANIKNAFVDLVDNLQNSGGFDGLKRGAEVAQAAIVLLDVAIVGIGKTIGALAGAVATLDFSGLKAAFADIEAEARKKLLGAAQHNDTLRASMGLSKEEAARLATEAGLAGVAVAGLGSAAAAAAPGMQGLAAAAGEAEVKAAAAALALGKGIPEAMAKIEGGELQQLADATLPALREQIEWSAASFDAMAKANAEAKARLAETDAAFVSLAASGAATQEQLRGALDAVSAATEEVAETADAMRVVQEYTLSKTAELNTALEALGTRAAQVLGVDLVEYSSKVSEEFARSSQALEFLVANFGPLKDAGVNAGAAVAAAIGQMTEAARNPAELQKLGEVVKQLGTEGKLAGDAVTTALEQIRRKADDITPGVNSVEEAFRKLGVTSQKEMDRAAAEAKQAFEVIRESGKATAEELQAAFTAYAEQAVAANGGVADATVKAQASALGLAVEVDKTGKVIVQTMAEAAFGVKGAGQALQDAADSARELGEAAGEAGESMVEAARAQNAAVKSVTVSLVDATTAQSRYADEAKRVASAVYNSALDQANSFRASAGAIDGARAAARLYIEEMERLDARQQEFSSNAAEGVEQLRLRLLELNGTEEQIASARQSRDQAEVLRTIELTRLDLRRAELRKDAGEVERLQREINLLQEQLGLIDQIYRAERRNRSNAASPAGMGGTGATSSGSAGGAGVQAAAPSQTFGARQTTLNINLPGSGIFSGDRASLEAFARQLGPVITDLQRKGAL